MKLPAGLFNFFPFFFFRDRGWLIFSVVPWKNCGCVGRSGSFPIRHGHSCVNPAREAKAKRGASQWSTRRVAFSQSGAMCQLRMFPRKLTWINCFFHDLLKCLKSSWKSEYILWGNSPQFMIALAYLIVTPCTIPDYMHTGTKRPQG